MPAVVVTLRLDPARIQLISGFVDTYLTGIEGVSSHAFRRTALTQMSNAGIPLKVIATYSGHRDLAQLNAYLEVKDEQVLGGAASLSMLSPVREVGKITVY